MKKLNEAFHFLNRNDVWNSFLFVCIKCDNIWCATKRFWLLVTLDIVFYFKSWHKNNQRKLIFAFKGFAIQIWILVSSNLIIPYNSNAGYCIKNATKAILYAQIGNVQFFSIWVLINWQQSDYVNRV